MWNAASCVISLLIKKIIYYSLRSKDVALGIWDVSITLVAVSIRLPDIVCPALGYAGMICVILLKCVSFCAQAVTVQQKERKSPLGVG